MHGLARVRPAGRGRWCAVTEPARLRAPGTSGARPVRSDSALPGACAKVNGSASGPRPAASWIHDPGTVPAYLREPEEPCRHPPLIRDNIARLFAAHFLSGGVPVVLFDRLPDTARADMRAFHR
jgi:hypothetical protein